MGKKVGTKVGVPVKSGLALEELFGLADGLPVGDLVGVSVATGLALGVDVVGKLFGLADGLAVGDLVGVAVRYCSSSSCNFAFCV